jgi:hypothetical protein
VVSGKVETTYFGIWSAEKMRQASILLSALGVRYEVREEEADRKTLEAWCAWDASAERPTIASHLWIWTADLPRLGTKIVEAFPERRFDARNSN